MRVASRRAAETDWERNLRLLKDRERATHAKESFSAQLGAGVGLGGADRGVSSTSRNGDNQ